MVYSLPSTTGLNSRLSASESLTAELKIGVEDVLRQVQALHRADQGKENTDMPAALIQYITHILLIMIIYDRLIDGLIGLIPLIYSDRDGSQTGSI